MTDVCKPKQDLPGKTGPFKLYALVKILYPQQPSELDVNAEMCNMRIFNIDQLTNFDRLSQRELVRGVSHNAHSVTEAFIIGLKADAAISVRGNFGVSRHLINFILDALKGLS